MIRIAVAIFLILHGLVHLLWFGVSWQLMEVDGVPYSTAVLAGRVDLGMGGIRLYGLLWVVATLAFVAAGLGLLFSAPWWWTATAGAALFSLLLCVLALPVGKFGALIDIAILAVLWFGSQYSLTFLPFPTLN